MLILGANPKELIKLTTSDGPVLLFVRNRQYSYPRVGIEAPSDVKIDRVPLTEEQILKASRIK